MNTLIISVNTAGTQSCETKQASVVMENLFGSLSAISQSSIEAKRNSMLTTWSNSRHLLIAISQPSFEASRNSIFSDNIDNIHAKFPEGPCSSDITLSDPPPACSLDFSPVSEP